MVVETCGHPGCTRPKRAKGFCKVHYRRNREGADMDAPIRTVKSKYGPTCSIPGCGRPHQAHGLCGAHCHRRSRGQDLLKPLKGDAIECSVEGCNRTGTLVRQMCRTHYARTMRTGNPGSPNINPRYRSVETECTVSGCEKGVYQRDVCRNHWYWHKTYSIPIEDIPEIETRGCEICGEAQNLHIDHDHACCPVGANPTCGNCNRGVLCANCNRGLGMMKDSPERLEAAAEYLRRTMVERLDTTAETE